ncbi:DUF6758 family protein [Thermomonospora catenispora]|uniref:DUF6758 family protein n=1 Tax=Thermomonospora catenispora TaxID=2493090 RepID=UPI0011220538|nr:DUF6758 family protein [Thermomonospora catenispora]TNY35177.1 hypothetical protein EIO00_19725 [Thermomonospora catenispora]
MRAEPTCPRCGRPVRAPGLWSNDWTCPVHGAVLPLQPARRPSREGLAALLQDARAPVWLPWPLPAGWLVTGFLDAGDERTGSRACAVALSGPNLMHGPADLLLIAEEPGVGLGARFAGVREDVAAQTSAAGPPNAVMEVRSASTRPHQVPLWAVDGAPDRAGYVGEAMGCWLWAVLWPVEAGALLMEELQLLDLRDPGMRLDVPFGAFCPRLRPERLRAAEDGRDAAESG